MADENTTETTTTETTTTAPPSVDLTKAPASLEEALAQINALKEQSDASKGSVPEWASKRIDQLTNNWRSEERQHAATKAQIKQLQTEIETLKKDGKVVQKLPDEVIEAQVQERATQIARLNEFNASCEKVVTAGKKAFEDFPSAMQKLHAISPATVQTPQGAAHVMPQEFVEAVLELDAPEKILHALAQPANNDEAARIMALSPAKQGAALAKFAQRFAPEISRTAPPVNPVIDRGRSGVVTNDLSDPKMSTAEWMKQREAEIRQQKEERRRRA